MHEKEQAMDCFSDGFLSVMREFKGSNRVKAKEPVRELSKEGHSGGVSPGAKIR